MSPCRRPARAACASSNRTTSAIVHPERATLRNREPTDTGWAQFSQAQSPDWLSLEGPAESPVIFQIQLAHGVRHSPRPSTKVPCAPLSLCLGSRERTGLSRPETIAAREPIARSTKVRSRFAQRLTIPRNRERPPRAAERRYAPRKSQRLWRSKRSRARGQRCVSQAVPDHKNRDTQSCNLPKVQPDRSCDRRLPRRPGKLASAKQVQM